MSAGFLGGLAYFVVVKASTATIDQHFTARRSRA